MSGGPTREPRDRAERAVLILQLYKSEGTVWFDDVSFTPIVTQEERERRQRISALQAQSVRIATELSRTAPEIAPGVRAKQTDHGIFLCNGRLALTLAGPSGAFGLCDIVDLKAGRSFVTPGFDDALFRIELRPRHAYGYSSTVVWSKDASVGGCSAEITRDGAEAVLRLRWEGVPAGGNPAVDAEATVRLGPTGGSR